MALFTIHQICDPYEQRSAPIVPHQLPRCLSIAWKAARRLLIKEEVQNPPELGMSRARREIAPQTLIKDSDTYPVASRETDMSQHQGRIYRIVHLSEFPCPTCHETRSINQDKQGLRALGLKEPRNRPLQPGCCFPVKMTHIISGNKVTQPLEVSLTT